MDTQWPRYYVFEKPDEEGVFIHAGSVHAPDAEMAVLIARDVFGRRPSRTAMLIVRDVDMYSRTAEELRKSPINPPPDVDAPEHTFLVFGKRTAKGVCVQLGEVRAVSHEGALYRALQVFGKDAAQLWWLMNAADVTLTGEMERDALFTSTPGKEYRHERHYPVRTMMRELRERKGRKSEDEPSS